jgi:hypothetical protein
MDPSTSTVSDDQNQTSDLPVDQAQQSSNLPTEPVQSSQQNKMPSTISVNKEGPVAVIAENPDVNQEASEIGPTTPELSAKQELEGIVEKSPDQEKPDLPKVVQDAGVTHSGPGVISVSQNNFGVTKMPAKTFQQAVEEEKKTPLHDSKHWFSALLMYIWRKINPKAREKSE